MSFSSLAVLRIKQLSRVVSPLLLLLLLLLQQQRQFSRRYYATVSRLDAIRPTDTTVYRGMQ
jgi:hypothetical protein